MEPNDYSTNSTPNPLARIAIEQLLNRQEDRHSPEAADRRAARRLCGRWITHRRMLRGMTRADVAQRVKLDEDTLGLLELGLTDAPLTAGEVWHRLALVLEGDARDYELAELVITVALGQASAPDGVWLDALAEEVEATVERPTTQAVAELAQADLPDETLQKADQLIHERATLPAHSLHVLRALRRAGGQSINIPELKQSIQTYERLRMSVIDLRRLLERLSDLRLVNYTRGDPSMYQITDVGVEALFVALRNVRAEQQKIAAERDREAAASAFERFIDNLPSPEGRT